MIRSSHPPLIKVGSGWLPIEIIEEPFLIYKNNSYKVFCEVLLINTGLNYCLALRSKSIVRELEVLREQNLGRIGGLRVCIRKKRTKTKIHFQIREIPK